jgi:hypothetical protein
VSPGAQVQSVGAVHGCQTAFSHVLVPVPQRVAQGRVVPARTSASRSSQSLDAGEPSPSSSRFSLTQAPWLQTVPCSGHSTFAHSSERTQAPETQD